MQENSTDRSVRIRKRLHDLLEAGHHAGDWVSTAVDTLLVGLIIANVIAFALETVDSIAVQYGTALWVFNVVSVLIFTVEYALRLWVCIDLPPLRGLPRWRARLRFARRPMLVIDLLAFLPFYLSLFFSLDLRILRVLRLLRFLKLVRYSPALQTLGHVISNEKRALIGACIVMLSLMMFASTIIYFLEREAQPEAFGSIPAATWWALATLTTVGYGDVTPVTALGKAFGSLMMIFGVGMAALPIGILATGFTQEIRRREFVVTWSMVATVPLFAQLDAASIAQVITQLRSQSYPEGAIILHPDDEIHSMYFVVDGEVELETASSRIVLGAGEFFGETALLDRDQRYVSSAKAVSSCDLMLLDRHDFTRLERENPEFRAQIEQVTKARFAE